MFQFHCYLVALFKSASMEKHGCVDYFCTRRESFICVKYLAAFPHTDDILMSPNKLNFKFFTVKCNSFEHSFHSKYNKLPCLHDSNKKFKKWSMV